MNQAKELWRTHAAQTQLLSMRPATHTLQQVLESLPAATISTADDREVRDAARQSADPLRRAWGLASDLRKAECEDYADWRHVATHWGASIVNAISCVLTGKRTADVSVPWLATAPFVPRPTYSTGDDGDYVLHSLAAAVWFVWATLSNMWGEHGTARPHIYMNSRLHKGKHQEHDGLHLWVRTCDAEQEAVCLVRVPMPLPVSRVAHERSDRICLRRGAPIGETLLYVYGIGVSEQPDEVGELLFKSCDPQVMIAVLVTMQLLSLAGSGEAGLPINVLEHPDLYQVGFETCLPEGVVWAALCCALGAMGLATLVLRDRSGPEQDYLAHKARSVLDNGLPDVSTPDVQWWAMQAQSMQRDLATCLATGKDVDNAVLDRMRAQVAHVRQCVAQPAPPPGLSLAIVCDEDDEYGMDWDAAGD
jgi:hypothetical protein